MVSGNIPGLIRDNIAVNLRIAASLPAAHHVGDETKQVL